MRPLASKHLNHGKNSEQLGTKSKKVINEKKTIFYKKKFQSKTKNDTWKVIHPVLSPNPKTLKVDPEKFNEFFNKTAERLVGKRKTDNATLRSYVSLSRDKSNSKTSTRYSNTSKNIY